MSSKPSITVDEDVTLVEFKNIKYNLDFLASMFDEIGQRGINVDMISLSPSQGALTGVSFTINDDDLSGILEYIAEIKKNTEIKSTVCSGNCKISIFDESMEDSPGFAAKIFRSIASTNIDLRLVTTSEVEISVLVDTASEKEVIESIMKFI